MPYESYNQQCSSIVLFKSKTLPYEVRTDSLNAMQITFSLQLFKQFKTSCHRYCLNADVYSNLCRDWRVDLTVHRVIIELLNIFSWILCFTEEISVVPKNYEEPISVAAGSKALVCSSSLDGIEGSNPAGAWMSFCCVCVLSGRVLCIGLITRTEEPCRVWCVSLSVTVRPW